jgi:ceramide glucosyltransferase
MSWPAKLLAPAIGHHAAVRSHEGVARGCEPARCATGVAEPVIVLRAASAAAVLALALLSLLYLVACVVVTWSWNRMRGRAQREWESGASARGDVSPPSVSVLKPLCGLEPGLEANLRSFCEQTHPTVEILFGARDPADLALAVARRVAAGTDRVVHVMAGARGSGANQKVNTLAFLLPHARSDVIVVADSDIRVGPTYVERVTAPLRDPRVGVTTCLYRGIPTGSVWSRLGALGVDEWFRPATLIARALGWGAQCFGATMAMRRDVLQAIGGFEPLASHLADDYELGARVQRLGLRTVVSDYEVATVVDEPTPAALLAHELRWMRAIRTVQPLGFVGMAITYALPTTLLAAAVSGRPWALALPVVAVLLRLGLHWATRSGPPIEAVTGLDGEVGAAATPWLVPLRDLMSFGVWGASFAGRRVVWRQQTLHLQANGVLYGGEEANPV